MSTNYYKQAIHKDNNLWKYITKALEKMQSDQFVLDGFQSLKSYACLSFCRQIQLYVQQRKMTYKIVSTVLVMTILSCFRETIASTMK